MIFRSFKKKLQRALSDPPAGFRLYLWDPPLLLLALFLGEYYYDLTGGLSWIIPFVMFHYFLFCNVIRPRFIYEIIWGALLLLHFYLSYKYSSVEWLRFFLIQSIATVTILFIEIFRRGYRGVFYEKFSRAKSA